MNIFITGDVHRDFQRIWEFAEKTPLVWSKEDVLIILGDAGINYYLDDDDYSLKYELSMLPFTLLCIKGNHELHADQIDSYRELLWHGGIVYCEEEYPNLLFAKDGEIYDFNGKKAIVIGGAYSVDKYARLRSGSAWFDTEQPSDTVKDYVERQLERAGWRVDYVLSHTAPKPYEPTWAFIPGLNQALVDDSTEKWLSTIEQHLDFEQWFCGHYHVESQEGPIRIMYEDYEEL